MTGRRRSPHRQSPRHLARRSTAHPLPKTCCFALCDLTTFACTRQEVCASHQYPATLVYNGFDGSGHQREAKVEWGRQLEKQLSMRIQDRIHRPCFGKQDIGPPSYFVYFHFQGRWLNPYPELRSVAILVWLSVQVPQLRRRFSLRR